MNIKNQIQRIINKRKQKLVKEIDEYETKMRDTVSYYGFGGPYCRQEAAKERREQELEEIEDFERQLQKATKHIKATVYAFGCEKCGAVCMTTKVPFDDWHECPTCRQMINLRDVSSHTIEIAEDTAEAWQEMLKESLEEAGR